MIHRPLEDWEYPDPDDEDDAADEYEEYDFLTRDESDTRPCPACGTEVYEDSDPCPVCGQYITFRNHALSGLPWWFVALGLLGIVMVILAMSGLM